MKAEISYTKSFDDYFSKICGSWYKAAQSIIETGKFLLEAKEQLGSSKFAALRRQLEDQNIMSNTTISKIMKIAENTVLIKAEYQKYLPPSYETLYQLSRQDDIILEEKICNHEITPEIQQKDVKEIFPYKNKPRNEPIIVDQKVVTIKGHFSGLSKEDYKKLVDKLDKLLKSFDLSSKWVDL